MKANSAALAQTGSLHPEIFSRTPVLQATVAESQPSVYEWDSRAHTCKEAGKGQILGTQLQTVPLRLL